MDSSAGHARRLAAGSLAQQAAQVTGLVTMFAVVTVLARELTLAELGVFGLLGSLAGYLLIVQNAAASAAVRNMAEAPDDERLRSAYSTALVLYAAGGVAAGALVAALGSLLSLGLDLSPALEDDALRGSLLLGAVTAVGWPATVERDVLRARGLFVRSAVTEIAALVAYAALVLGLALGGADLALVIAAGGAIPLLAGLGCLLVARASGVAVPFDRRAVRAQRARELLGLAGYVSLSEALATAIYVVDRAILGLFASAATVGLFEGPVRAHNLVRSLNSATTVTVLPTAARFKAAGDTDRLRQLLLRGARYSLALMAPIAVTGAVLAAPLLEAWLGPDFRQAAPAMAILLGHWLLSGCTGVLGGVLVGAGRPRAMAVWAGAVAAGNLILALALVPGLDLEGVAIATTVPYLLAFPLLAGPALRAATATPADLIREALKPALALAAVLGGLLAAVRFGLEPEGLRAFAVALAALLAYWAAYYAIWLRPDERALVRSVAGGPLRRSS